MPVSTRGDRVQSGNHLRDGGYCHLGERSFVPLRGPWLTGHRDEVAGDHLYIPVVQGTLGTGRRFVVGPRSVPSRQLTAGESAMAEQIPLELPLTTALKDRTSQISRLVDAAIAEFLDPTVLEHVRTQIAAAQLQCPPPQFEYWSYAMLVGTAFDYAVRLTTWPDRFTWTKTAAYWGMGSFFAGLRSFSALYQESAGDPFERPYIISPGLWSDGTKDISPEEIMLDILDIATVRTCNESALRCLAVLADFENYGRSGSFILPWAQHFDEEWWGINLALESPPTPKQRELLMQLANMRLEIVPDTIISDLASLITHYLTTSTYRKWRRSEDVILNPHFNAGVGVTRVDADWLVDRTLVEMKTTKRPRQTIRSDLRQAIGYCILDRDDAYRIERVALYYPRFDVCCEIPLGPRWRERGEEWRAITM